MRKLQTDPMCSKCGRMAGSLSNGLCTSCVIQLKDSFAMTIAGCIMKDKTQASNEDFWVECYRCAEIALEARHKHFDNGDI